MLPTDRFFFFLEQIRALGQHSDWVPHLLCDASVTPGEMGLQRTEMRGSPKAPWGQGSWHLNSSYIIPHGHWERQEVWAWGGFAGAGASLPRTPPDQLPVCTPWQIPPFGKTRLPAVCTSDGQLIRVVLGP